MSPRQSRVSWRWNPARLWSDEEGATAIEYGLIAAMIAAFLVTALLALSSAESNMYAAWTNAANSALGE